MTEGLFNIGAEVHVTDQISYPQSCYCGCHTPSLLSIMFLVLSQSHVQQLLPMVLQVFLVGPDESEFIKM